MDERKIILCEEEDYPDFLRRAVRKIYDSAMSLEIDLANPWEMGWRKGLLSALNMIRIEKAEEREQQED